jgi:exonuclease SbcD
VTRDGTSLPLSPSDGTSLRLVKPYTPPMLPRFQFLHAADLHLDSPLRGLERYAEAPVERIRGATREAFQNLVRFAIDARVEFVILAGDVFDGDWKDWNTGLWFAARLRELTKEGIRVYLLAGNHDAEGRMTASLPHDDGVFVFDTKAPQTIVDSPTGTLLHGQGFANAETLDDLAARYPQARGGAFEIGVLHTALSGREGHAPYAPCTTDALKAKGYDYWALGHVHRREVIAEEPWIVFPGNLQARHVRETGAKGATLVTVEDGRVREVRHESLDVVRFARLEVDVAACARRSACEDRVARALALAREQAEGRLLAARVEIVGATSADAALRREQEALVAAIRDRGNSLGDIWIEKVVLRTRPESTTIGRDVLDTLDLEAKDLLAITREAAREELDVLLSKLPPGIDLTSDGLDLRDDRTLDVLLAAAREEVVRRLVDADSHRAGEGDSR